MKEKIGIYQGWYNRFDLTHFIYELEHHGREVEVFGKVDEIHPNIQGLMIAGGDGTLRLVFDSLLDNNYQISPLIVLRGGTCNAFHRGLVDVGATVTNQDLYDGVSPLNTLQFKPGTIGSTQFIVDIGTGTCEPQIGLLNEVLRTYLDFGQLRPKVAAIASWIYFLTQKYDGVPIFNLYTVSPYYGVHKMFSEQALGDEYVTNASIASNTKIAAAYKSFWTFLCLGNGFVRLSKLFLNIQKEKFFSLERPIRKFRLGGDYVAVEANTIPEGTRITRSNKSTPFVALV